MTIPDVQFVSVGGVRTTVRICGDGPPLLLVMGIWGEIDCWAPLLTRLSGFQSIMFDAPGIGATEVPPYPLSLPALGHFAAGVLEAVGVPRAHVLGVSFGGLVAQQLATVAPRKVDRLVLVSTSSGLLHLPGQPAALLQLLNPLPTDTAGRHAGRIFGGRIRREPDLLPRLGLRPPRSVASYLHRLSGLTGWWGMPWSIHQPTLVVTGDDDPIVPATNSRILTACLPNARLHIVPGGGHLVLFDSPAEVVPVIRDFLAADVGVEVGTLAS